MDLEGALGASEARWRAIVDSAVDGIIVIDAHGRIEAFNRAAERLFGYTNDEVLGRNVDILMPSPYREEHDAYLSRYLATGRAKIIGSGREVRGLRKDGTTFPLHLSVGEITIDGQTFRRSARRPDRDRLPVCWRDQGGDPIADGRGLASDVGQTHAAASKRGGGSQATVKIPLATN